MAMAESVTISPLPDWPSTSSRLFFLYDASTSVNYQASVVSANRWTFTFVVDCPTPCASNDVPEVTITQKDGGQWAGNHVQSGSLTAWGCDLGSAKMSGKTIGPQCSATTVNADDDLSLPAKGTDVDECFILSHSDMVTITAGMDKMYKYVGYYEYTYDWESIVSRTLEELKCSATPTSTAHTTDVETRTSETGTGSSSQEASETAESAAIAAHIPKSLVLFGLVMTLVRFI